MRRARNIVFVAALADALTSHAIADQTPAIVNEIDLRPFRATQDVVDFVLAIAKPTVSAPGDRSGERVVTIGRNGKGELVVTSMQLVVDGQAPNFPAGTIAAMIVRHAGVCQPPHGEADASALTQRIYSFFVDYRGDTVWELGFLNGLASFHELKGAGNTGPEETFNIDPAKYKTYPCAKYD